MTIDAMRSALAECYPGPRWLKRVKDMADDRVIAMYKRFEREGNLHKRDQKKKKDDQ